MNTQNNNDIIQALQVLISNGIDISTLFKKNNQQTFIPFVPYIPTPQIVSQPINEQINETKQEEIKDDEIKDDEIKEETKTNYIIQDEQLLKILYNEMELIELHPNKNDQIKKDILSLISININYIKEQIFDNKFVFNMDAQFNTKLSNYPVMNTGVFGNGKQGLFHHINKKNGNKYVAPTRPIIELLNVYFNVGKFFISIESRNKNDVWCQKWKVVFDKIKFENYHGKEINNEYFKRFTCDLLFYNESIQDFINQYHSKEETKEETKDETKDETKEETKEESKEETNDETKEETKDETKEETKDDISDLIDDKLNDEEKKKILSIVENTMKTIKSSSGSGSYANVVKK